MHITSFHSSNDRTDTNDYTIDYKVIIRCVRKFRRVRRVSASIFFIVIFFHLFSTHDFVFRLVFEMRNEMRGEPSKGKREMECDASCVQSIASAFDFSYVCDPLKFQSPFSNGNRKKIEAF